MKSFIIDIEIYDSKVHVLYDATDEEFSRYMFDNFKVKKDRLQTSAACWLITSGNGVTRLVDFRTKLKQDAYSVNTIVHESDHVAFEMMKELSIPYVYETTDEVHCYLCAFIAGKIYEEVFKK